MQVCCDYTNLLEALASFVALVTQRLKNEKIIKKKCNKTKVFFHGLNFF